MRSHDKVLVVDDAAFMRMAIKNMLESNGMEIVGEAENGAVAVKICGVKPDLVKWILRCRNERFGCVEGHYAA